MTALVIAGVAVKEGVEAWRGEHCDDCASIAGNHAAEDGCACGPDCKDGC